MLHAAQVPRPPSAQAPFQTEGANPAFFEMRIPLLARKWRSIRRRGGDPLLRLALLFRNPRLLPSLLSLSASSEHYRLCRVACDWWKLGEAGSVLPRPLAGWSPGQPWHLPPVSGRLWAPEDSPRPFSAPQLSQPSQERARCSAARGGAEEGGPKRRKTWLGLGVVCSARNGGGGDCDHGRAGREAREPPAAAAAPAPRARAVSQQNAGRAEGPREGEPGPRGRRRPPCRRRAPQSPQLL